MGSDEVEKLAAEYEKIRRQAVYFAGLHPDDQSSIERALVRMETPRALPLYIGIARIADMLRTTLSAQPAAVDGWVMVPKEPTEEMKKAGMEAAIKSEGVMMPIPLDLKIRLEAEGLVLEGPCLLYTGLDEYRAMIAAAPKNAGGSAALDKETYPNSDGGVDILKEKALFIKVKTTGGSATINGKPKHPNSNGDLEELA